MSRQRQIKPFFLVITDRDKGLFNVIGPMSDDTSWNDRVCKAQESGRQVNCHNPNLYSRESIITAVEKQLGLKYTDIQVV